MFAAKPPYALAPTSFRFGALASLAGRSPLGGRREVALALYLAARLAHDALPDRAISREARAERATGARHWLSVLALPSAPVRANLAKLIEASAGSPGEAAEALGGVMAVTAQFLEGPARSELEQLARALAGARVGA